MKTHLFLTGEKQIGKTTAIQRFLEARPDLKVDGIRTIRTDQVYDGGISIHILRAGTGECPSPENLLFLKRGTTRAEAAARFDMLGCTILRAMQDPDLILLDEIGPREADAKHFQEEIFHLLEQDVPVLGVLQVAESSFVSRIRSHENVRLIVVTAENRDAVPEQIHFWYNNQSNSDKAK